MADAIISALAGTIMGNLNSQTLQELGLSGGGLKTELENLKRTFRTIQAVLQDAEEKMWKSEPIKVWLRHLKDAAYDADDLLDEFAIETQWRQQRRDLKHQVRSFFSWDHNPIVFRKRMVHKLKNVREELDAIAKDRHNFHLREGAVEIEADSFDRRQTWSRVGESEIYGRSKQIEELINMLLISSDDFSIYAICGMGGLGKTTLAQLVYNDPSIKGHFDLQIWVCVSVDFNIKRVTTAIIESILGTSPNIQQLDNLLQCLQEKFGGKKFLLVLDDMWDDDHDEWKRLKDALSCGAKGSAVIVTTRLGIVADSMAATHVQHLETLSDNDSWILFKQLAFGMRRREEYARLEKIGVAIVKKCGGIPLAIRALGSLMRLKNIESEWLSVKESEIWDLPKEGSKILPALSLSYINLKPPLKQCFAFCSIFPKDYAMRKERLIALWMAMGFISGNGRVDLHHRGEAIFHELVGRSFFQEVKYERLGNITCKMHDLIHDLARSVMKHECFLIEGNAKFQIPKQVRHVGVYKPSLFALEDKDFKSCSLHSFLLHDDHYYTLPEILCFTRQKHLRALDIRNYNAKKLPKSICNLKHLRFLDVSHSFVTKLPESVTSLQNLQTLNLSHCIKLIKLPKGTKHMKELVYLDLTGCVSLRFMPCGMQQLTCLRKLTMFIVGKDDGQHIRELERLNDLSGELSITNLVNVKDLTDAKRANLMGKTALTSVSLSWHCVFAEPECRSSFVRENIEEVIDGFQPHSNLKRLGVDGYGGSKFPNWMMNLHMVLPNLVQMELIACHNCEQLPPLGKLQFLKILILSDMDGVKHIGSDFYGDLSYGENPFPSLETLNLVFMKSLEHWELPPVIGRSHSFPRLRELYVVACPLLIEIPIIPSVKTFEIT